MKIQRWLGIVFCFFSLSAGATKAPKYVKFDPPDGWKCEISQAVWICQSTNDTDRKESVILSIATVATDWDSLDNFESYLKQVRPYKDDSGSLVTPKITYTRRRNINGFFWVDSLQLNSELPGFWARYVATVQNKLAILITYIVSEENYSKLAPQFERMVASLKPNSDFDASSGKLETDPVPGSTKLGTVQKDILAERLNLRKKPVEKAAEEPEPEPETESSSLTWIVLVGAIAVIAVIVIRRRKKAKTLPPG